MLGPTRPSRRGLAQLLGCLLALLPGARGLVPCKAEPHRKGRYSCRGEANVSNHDPVGFYIPGEAYRSFVGRRFVLKLQAAAEPSTPLMAGVILGSSIMGVGPRPAPLRCKVICLGPEDTESATLVTSVQPMIPNASLKLRATIAPVVVYQAGEKAKLVPRHGQAAAELFQVDAGLMLTGKAVLRIRSHQAGDGHPQRVYVLPVNGTYCGYDHLIASLGCVEAEQLIACLETISSMSDLRVAKAFSLDVRSKGDVTLSAWSRPKLSEGQWLVLIRPGTGTEGPVKYTVSLHGDTEGRWPIWAAALFVLVLPLLVVLLLVFINDLLKRWGHETQGGRVRDFFRCWLGLDEHFNKEARERLQRNFKLPSYTSLVVGGSAALFTAASQLSIGLWRLTSTSGNQDLCYYNFGCFVPYGVNLPFNNILSHIPYFCCGLLTFAFVLHVDIKPARMSILRMGGSFANVESREMPDRGVFYALSMAIVMEGFGSICYHICPDRIQFQFDTAMMFVIAMLSMLALVHDRDKSPQVNPIGSWQGLDLSAVEVETRGAGGQTVVRVSPVALLLAVAVPMWTVSFVGTWFDYVVPKGTQTTGYTLYCISAMSWLIFLLVKAERLFPNVKRKRTGCGLNILRLLVGAGLLVVLVSDDMRLHLGGMSNVLLGISVLAMGIVVVRHILRHQLEDPCSCTPSSFRELPGLLAKLSSTAVFLLLSYIALVFFKSAPTDITKEPAHSREQNQSCILLGTFDAHDVWHMFSAVALALWVLLLLEMQLWTEKLEEKHRRSSALGASRIELLEGRQAVSSYAEADEEADGAGLVLRPSLRPGRTSDPGVELPARHHSVDPPAAQGGPEEKRADAPGRTSHHSMELPSVQPEPESHTDAPGRTSHQNIEPPAVQAEPESGAEDAPAGPAA